MSKITSNDFKRGSYILFRGAPHQIVSFQHSYVGRGSAHVSAKLKNIQTGKTIDHTFRAGENLEKAEIFIKEMQYLYAQDDECFFMNAKTYDQVSISKKTIGTIANFLKEGEFYQIITLGDDPVNIRAPKKVSLEVTEAADAVKGNTAASATKSVTVETGVVVSVPLFIKQNDIIVINPETGEYVERG